MSGRAHIFGCVTLALSCVAFACGSEPDTRNARPGGSSSSDRATTDNPVALAGAGAQVDIIDVDAGPTVCDVAQLVATPQVPDMMIVLDRSSSMEEGGRWRPSVSAVRDITMKLESSVRFGLTLFPASTTGAGGWLGCLATPGQSQCFNDLSAVGGQLLCIPGEIVVPVAARNATAIARALDRTRPNGSTPTSDTLQRLIASYADADVEPDAELHPKYILLVTDGAPTCPAGDGTETVQADIDASNAALDTLREHHVATYVIGYDTTGPGNEMLASVLDGFAKRGGTGDDKHRAVEDQASLLGEFQKIAAAITSCDFDLDKTPERADYVLVTLDDRQLDLDDTDGWRLIGKRTIRLVGAACKQFREGTHSVNAEIRCSAIQPS